MKTRTLRIHFTTPISNDSSQLEWATIETKRGYYVASVERCADEGRRRFRNRARSVMQALEQYQGPIVTTSPDEC